MLLLVLALSCPALPCPPQGLVEGESKPLEPILFITTPGADPSQELAEYASTALAKSGGHLHELAMGQGQAEKAIALLRDAAKDGEGTHATPCQAVHHCRG